MTTETLPRIEPVAPKEWTDEIYDAASAFPASRDFVLDNWEHGEARGMNGLGAILNHPSLAKGFLTFNNHVAKENTLSKRECEILILRASWLRKSEYEFQQHVILGLRAGITESEIEAIQIGADAPNWQPIDALLIKAADGLIENASIDQQTWLELAKHYNKHQLMDIVFTVGCYEVLAMAFKSFQVPFEDCLEPMSEDTKARMYE